MRLPDLFECGVRHHHHHHVAKGDGLFHRAGLGERTETRRHLLEILGMARREHHRIARLDEQSAKRAAHASGPDRADLEWRRRWRLGPGARRPGAENGPSKSAPSKMEQMPAAVINGLIPCHVSLHVHVDAAGRSTPLSFTNQYSSSRQPASRRRSVDPSR